MTINQTADKKPAVKTFYDLEATTLARQVVGRSITSIDKDRGTITLDNGKTLKFYNAGMCCAWYDYKLLTRADGTMKDNVVTAVTTDYSPAGPELLALYGYRSPDDLSHFTLKIIAGAAGPIAGVEITGDPTSGFYCTSISMDVIDGPAPSPERKAALGLLAQPDGDVGNPAGERQPE